MISKRKRQTCPKCNTEDFLMQDGKDQLYCLECEFAFRKRMRQGRNKESRERENNAKDLRRKICEANNGLDPDLCELVCSDCNRNDFVEDHASGDMICLDCGVVKSTGGLGFNQNMILMKNQSKNYKRVVHFQQRISQLMATDPELDDEVFERIREVLENVEKTYQIGKKHFCRLFKRMGINPKMASHWIQLRVRLGWEESIEFHPDFLLRLKARYFCLDRAFDATLFIPTGTKRTSPLQRKNIINLNFSIPMLIRLEDEETFRRVAKYFPQLTNQNHPNINNERWKVLMEYCQKTYQRMVLPVKEMEFYFEWPYIPLTYEDIFGYFSDFS